ncbi:MAG: tRNA (guanosine(37)-N1)-methyltransferase TrmD [Parcubacteria group bacterium]|jgi:tRNA (guanine37-N1)-methyltransferase
MKFDIITIFPKIFDSYFAESILARAQKKNLIEIKIHNLRDYATDKHQTVDDTPYGGGAGMVLKIEPIWRCVQFLKSQVPISKLQTNSKFQISNSKNVRVILFSAKGKKYTQADAKRLAQYKNLILICGRYEGVDERVAQNIIDEEFSIGEYVLTGGEIPAMIVVDSVSRLLPEVLGNKESLMEESFGSSLQFAVNSSQTKEAKNSSQMEDENSKFKIKNSKFSLEYPHYTKPEEFNGWKVPDVLLSGNHKEIEKWKKENSGI